MSNGAYPIVRFLNRLMEDDGFTSAEFVQTLGYRNLDRGLQRLNLWLDNAAGHNLILKQIATTYPDHAEGLEMALAETKAIRTAEFEARWIEECKAEEATFIPFLNAEGEKTVPSGICIFGISGGHRAWTMIDVPNAILEFPLDDQLPELMAAYRSRFNGVVPFFGRLTGFKFARLLDYFQFDAEGVLVGRVERPFRCSGCSLGLR